MLSLPWVAIDCSLLAPPSFLRKAHPMISAIEYLEDVTGGHLKVRLMPHIAEVVIEYVGIDGALHEEEFSFTSGAALKSEALAVARRMDVTRAEYQRVYNGMDKMLDVIDLALQEV